MSRPVTLFTFACLALLASVHAPKAEATSIMLSRTFTAVEVYPDAVRALQRARRMIQEISGRRPSTAYEANVLRRHYAQAMDLGRRAQAALQQTPTTRLVIWGDATEDATQENCVSFLRNNPRWRGGTVHIFKVRGSYQFSRRKPGRFDDSKSTSSRSDVYRPARRRTHVGVSTSGLKPLPNIPTGSLFGVGEAAR